MKQLEGKAYLVTGAGGGIGAACAKLLVEDGARLLLVDVDEARGRAQARALGEAACFVRADVSDEHQVASAVNQAVETFGALDGLVNNAGVAGAGESIAQADVAEFDRMMAVMARGTLLGMKHAARVMIPRRSGAIVNVASIAAVHSGFGTHSYSAIKAAVVQLTRSVAMELAEHNVRVNAVLPGPVATRLLGGVFGMPDEAEEAMIPLIEKALARRQPSGQAGRPEDVARAIVWLLGEDASFVMGHGLVVDGCVSGGELWSRRQARGTAARSSVSRRAGS